MANPTSSMPLCGSERFPAHPAPSPVMIGFVQVLAAAQDLIVAEVDLLGNPGHDPAFDSWFSDASRTRTRVLDIIGAVLDLAIVEPGDTNLMRVLRLFRRVIISDNPEEMANLRFAIEKLPAQFFALGIEGIDGAVNRLVLRGLDSIEQYLTLEELKAEAAAPARVDDDVDMMPMF